MRWRPRLSGLQSVQLAIPPQRRVPHRLLQGPEWRQVLGRAPGNESGAVAVAPELDRQGPDEAAGQALQQFRREPGKPGTAGQGEEAGGAEAQDGDDACRPLPAQLRQDRGERRAGFVVRGGRWPVEVDPRVSKFGGFGPCRVARVITLAEALTGGVNAAMIGWVFSTDPYGLRNERRRWPIARSRTLGVVRAGIRLQGGRRSEELQHCASRRMPRIALKSRGERSGERGIRGYPGPSRERGIGRRHEIRPVLDEERVGTSRNKPADRRERRREGQPSRPARPIAIRWVSVRGL